METPEIPGMKILRLLPLVAREIGFVPKDGHNKAQNYKFRGIDDALHCGPIFAKHGITVMPKVSDHKVWSFEKPSKNGPMTVFCASLTMSLTFYADDQSSVEAIMVGDGMDYSGGHASAIAMSMAYKYAIFFGLQLAVEPGAIDDPDHDRPQDRDQHHANGSGATNGTSAPSTGADKFDGFLSYLKKAPTNAKRAECWSRVEKYVEQNEFTHEEFRELEQANLKRKADLEMGVSR